ncbi:MAG: pyridoxal phosphate-dependent aminotransferase [Methanocalculus sp. MSAO_Arc1]|uniref:pyridoxal phosphate-dependent aminotransferase n=1 Tax=unclassified Methanocalculus TaxID=2631035 RepID=UPI000FF417D1|nr:MULTISPECIES: pyridoxal phosphate-dependent aminotransferase [unclassified Methanocalculus]MCP1661598.1 aspartate aminotransferase [Methanocalculus sp. AMF5]RQD81321.1 MAG: pyridoxal phosphate-dependent aminotransferase [Methanocalculus sp. MSAO_Arc1]
MRQLSDTIGAITPSATMAIADRAKEMVRNGIDVISLSIGEPDFETPPHITEAAIDALRRGETHYAPSRGIPELLDAVADKLSTENGIPASPADCIVTAGAKDAIRLCCQAVLNPGDEVIILDPSWVSYEPCLQMAGAQAVHYPLDPVTFQPGESLAEAITPATRMIIVNSPSNPTGSVLTRSSLGMIADLCSDHDLLALSDEIYEKLVYDGAEHIPLASIHDMAERTVTVNGFSKAYAMTGWRLGYAAGPSQVISYMNRIQQHSVSHPTTFVMWGGVAALKGDQSCVLEMREEFAKRRTFMMASLQKAGYRSAPADGAFYAFAEVGGDDVATASSWLEEKHVAVTPGSAFGAPGWVRLSYATSMDRLEEAVERLWGE